MKTNKRGPGSVISYVLLGAVTGVFSGLLGIGGGIILIPALVLLVGFTQHEAQGTSMVFLTAPFGLLAALTYYQSGNADVAIAVFVGIGFFFGAFLGAKVATRVPNVLLKRVFGVALLLIAVYWLLK